MASESHPARPRRRPAGDPARVRGVRPAIDLPRTRLQAAPGAPGPAAGPIEIVVIGCSRESCGVGIPALQALEAAGTLRVAGTMETDGASRAYLQTAFPHAAAAASLENVSAPPGSLAVIGSAPRFHPAHATAAFKRGWHVLCESPLAATAREAQTILAAAHRHERMLGVDLHRRFFPAARYIRSLCRDHLLGPVFGFHVHEGEPPNDARAPAPEKLKMPDGVLTELGAPTLDLLAWWLGDPLLVRYADDAMGGMESNAFLELSFPERVRGTVQLSHDWPTSQTYTIMFERGIVQWKVGDAAGLIVQLASAPAALQARLAQPLTPRDLATPRDLLMSSDESFAAQLENVIGAIGRREPMGIPANDALRALTVIDECYARRQLLEQPWLTRNEAAHGRALSAPSAIRRG